MILVNPKTSMDSATSTDYAFGHSWVTVSVTWFCELVMLLLVWPLWT